MIKMYAYDYQPGTGTRYLLLAGKVEDERDAEIIGCRVGSLYVVWEGHGAHSLGEGVVHLYVMEKFRLKEFPYDAMAITQFARKLLHVPQQPDPERGFWGTCKICECPIAPRLAKDQDTCVTCSHSF